MHHLSYKGALVSVALCCFADNNTEKIDVFSLIKTLVNSKVECGQAACFSLLSI